MKTLVRIVLFFAVLGFVFLFLATLTASAANVPGGVVFVEDNNIVYHDFQTADKINLTAGLNAQFGPNTEFAVSGDGITLFWVDEIDKVCLRISPNANPLPITVSSEITGPKAIRPYLAVAGIKNLVASYTGQNLAFEYPKRDKFQPDFCNATVYFQIDGSRTHDIVAKNDTYWQCNSCGNTATTFAWRGTLNVHNLVYTAEQAATRTAIKRNAHFGCWSQTIDSDKQMFAVIYQTAAGWGPIEIRTKIGYGSLIAKYFGRKHIILSKEEQMMKPGVYEIPAQMNSCDGLAWKPNGDLTCFSESKAYIISRQEIDRGIAQSGIDLMPTGGFQVAPRNNELKVQPHVSLVERGTGYCWLTKSQLVFRDKDGYLQLQENGNSTTIMDSIPEKFCFCKRPPFTQTLVVESSGARRGESVAQRYGFGHNPVIVGDLIIDWAGDEYGKKYVHLYWGDKNLELSMLQEKNLDQVTDPAVYEYQPRVSDRGSTVPFDAIMLIRLEGKYYGIQPTNGALKMEFMSKEDIDRSFTKRMRDEMKGKEVDRYGYIEIGGKKMGLRKPMYEWLTYRWKYWPQAGAQQIARRDD